MGLGFRVGSCMIGLAQQMVGAQGASAQSVDVAAHACVWCVC